jgi:hypothetical protein
MVVRIATWNMENLFKPPNKFGPKTQQEYNAKLDALAAARPDPRHRARGNTAQTRNTMGGRRACRTPRHAVGQRGRDARDPLLS